MRKPALFAAAILLSASSLFAQDGGATANGTDRNFHFGLNFTPGVYFPIVGSLVTAGNTTYSNAANAPGFGYGYGVNLEFYFTQNYGLATGVEVLAFQANYTNTTDTLVSGKVSTSDQTVHQQSMQYLEIPLLLKFRTNSIGMIKSYGEFGLSLGGLLSASDNNTVTRSGVLINTTSTTTNAVNIYSSSSFFRVGLDVGLGLEYNIAGPTSIQGAIHYDNAFTNMNSNSNNSVIMKGINLVIGVLF
jgi:hypothetical protein